jgi:hypothetical protein
VWRASIPKFMRHKATTAPGLALVRTNRRHHRLTSSSAARLGAKNSRYPFSHSSVPAVAASSRMTSARSSEVNAHG